MLSTILVILAVAVAAVYFTIAALVVPQIALPRASKRFVTLFRLAAISFFIGCGLSHFHIAVNAYTEPGDVRLHELGFHVVQVVGGAIFVIAALRFLEIQVQVKKTEADHRLGQLEELASRDPLTGAYNRRFFEEELGKSLARNRRDDEPFAVALLDIDDFKAINDSFGHTIGDAVLTLLVVRLNELIRPTDSLVRFGGDEFGLILSRTDGLAALRIAERVRATAAKPSADGVPPITVSIGIAACPEHGSSAEDLLRRSDEALYRSKRSGKNRSTASKEIPAPTHA